VQKHLFFRSLFSGYGMIAVGAGCSLVSVPLALRFLPAEEFGLWAVVLQVVGYFALADTGVSSSIGRLLIDHRAARPSKQYGGVFWGGLAALCGLAVFVMGVGLAVVPFLPVWLGVDAGLHDAFVGVAAVQVGVTAASLPVRAVGQSILAAGRYDLLHACLIVSLLANLAALAAALALGAGVFSFAWAGVAGLATSAVGQYWAAAGLGTLPGHKEHALPTRGEWQPILSFARDVVCLQVGNALVFSTQAVVVSSTLGLVAAASWAAGSKLFFLFFQLTGKVSEVAGPQLAGLAVARSHESLARATRNIVVATAAAAAIGAGALAFGNAAFVSLWTGGKIAWPHAADPFLAAWLILASVAAALTTRALAGKELRRIRHIYLLEGIFGTALAAWAVPRFGLPAVPASYAIACLLCSFRATVASAVKWMRNPSKNPAS
jgi:O-antigen/teichoic acid export membrane protein